jgi:hypothetical protein
MKKCILLASFFACSTLPAMNNADPRPVKFAPAPILFHRLDQYDKKHQSEYAKLAVSSRLHDVLGNRSWTRAQAGDFVKKCVKENNSHLSDSQQIEHKQTIMNILHPEVTHPELPAKL